MRIVTYTKGIQRDEVVGNTTGDRARVLLGGGGIRLVRVVGGDDSSLASLVLSVVD